MISNIVKLNTAIGVSAFLFQVTVLYPWHNNISKQIYAMDKKLNLLTQLPHEQKTINDVNTLK
jgi:hypothetical protein